MQLTERNVRPDIYESLKIGSHAVIGPAQFYATPAVVLNDGIFLARTNEARNGLVQISRRKIAQREFYIGWSYEALKRT